jgi:hypothetical protein
VDIDNPDGELSGGSPVPVRAFGKQRILYFYE